jgi:hypothetical protein
MYGIGLQAPTGAADPRQPIHILALCFEPPRNKPAL